MWGLGAVEAVSFAVLLVVAAAGGHPAALAVTGFVHGSVYLVSLATAWRLVPDGRAQGLAVVPGVGALLMARHLTARPVSPPVGPSRSGAWHPGRDG